MGDARGTRVTSEDVETVFEAWRARRARPDLTRLTQERRDLIRSRLALGYTVEDLVCLMRYAYEASSDEALWWRGGNPRRVKYMDLSNLLRKEKLGGRVDRAREWEDSLGNPAAATEDPQPDFRRGRLAVFRGGRR